MDLVPVGCTVKEPARDTHTQTDRQIVIYYKIIIQAKKIHLLQYLIMISLQSRSLMQRQV